MTSQHVRTTNHGVRTRLALVLGVALVAACGGDDSEANASEIAVEAAADDADAAADEAAAAAEVRSSEVAAALRDNGLTSVASAVELIDFAEIVDAPDFTFFAPNDEAFQVLTADELADLLADAEAVADVLRNHTVAGKVGSGDLSDGRQLDTEAGETLTVAIDGETVTIGDATVVGADVDVNDGVIHVVDRLLVP